jgi:hypothetical protein
MDREQKPHGKVIKDSLPIDAPLISQVSVNLDVLPVHAAVNHFRPGKLRRETVQPRGDFAFLITIARTVCELLDGSVR